MIAPQLGSHLEDSQFESDDYLTNRASLPYDAWLEPRTDSALPLREVSPQAPQSHQAPQSTDLRLQGDLEPIHNRAAEVPLAPFASSRTQVISAGDCYPNE